MENLKLIKRKDINKKYWDNCIQSDPNALIYANTWYLDAVCSNWCAVVLVGDGKYEFVFPIPFRNKLGIKYVYTPSFIQQLGCMGNFMVSKEHIVELIKLIRKEFSFCDIQIKKNRVIQSTRFFKRERINLILNLNSSYDFLQKNYSTNHKRNLKKTGGLTIKSVNKIDNIVKLFKQSDIMKQSNFKKDDFERLNKLTTAVSNNAEAEFIHVIDDKKEVISGAIVFNWNNRLTFIFSGNSKNGKKVNGLLFLLDDLIKRYANQSIYLDFEGSESPGLNRFYSGFGAEEELYLFCHYNKLNRLIKRLKK